MNKHRRFRWGVVAVTSALVTLAACGGEGGSESNDQTTATLRLAVGTAPGGLDPHPRQWDKLPAGVDQHAHTSVTRMPACALYRLLMAIRLAVNASTWCALRNLPP